MFLVTLERNEILTSGHAVSTSQMPQALPLFCLRLCETGPSPTPNAIVLTRVALPVARAKGTAMLNQQWGRAEGSRVTAVTVTGLPSALCFTLRCPFSAYSRCASCTLGTLRVWPSPTA